MTDENWLPIPGCPGYEASDLGRIRSLRQRRRGPHVLAPAASGSGHLLIGLRVNGQSVTRSVHRLILLTFVGPPPEGQEVRHLDGNPKNNVVSNLQYGTRAENQLDSVRHGTHHHAVKTHCPQGHPLEGDNLYTGLSRSGRPQRGCKACRNAARRVKVLKLPNLDGLSAPTERRCLDCGVVFIGTPNRRYCDDHRGTHRSGDPDA